MPTQQIPKEQWNDYLSGFSAHNQTRPVIIDMESTELGPQRIIDKKPLLAIEPDLKDEHEPAIFIVAGDPDGGDPAALKHAVMNPVTIWVKSDDQGRAESVDIETEDGKTILQFAA